MESSKPYRERVYIIKDIILTLAEYGELNQTALSSFCGLNITKHKNILDQLEKNGLLSRIERTDGKRTITFFKPTTKGMQFCKDILDPFEELFPRGTRSNKSQFLIFI